MSTCVSDNSCNQAFVPGHLAAALFFFPSKNAEGPKKKNQFSQEAKNEAVNKGLDYECFPDIYQIWVVHCGRLWETTMKNEDLKIHIIWDFYKIYIAQIHFPKLR